VIKVGKLVVMKVLMKVDKLVEMKVAGSVEMTVFAMDYKLVGRKVE
jgi:hypothetical protein